jgi:hypothetical protein
MEDNVLLKIRRDYTHDEAINFVMESLRESKFRNGELLSENAELKYANKLLTIENDLLKKEINHKNPKLTKEDVKEQRFVELNKKLIANGSEIKKLKSDVDLWRSKYLNLNKQLSTKND